MYSNSRPDWSARMRGFETKSSTIRKTNRLGIGKAQILKYPSRIVLSAPWISIKTVHVKIDWRDDLMRNLGVTNVYKKSQLCMISPSMNWQIHEILKTMEIENEGEYSDDTDIEVSLSKIALDDLQGFESSSGQFYNLQAGSSPCSWDFQMSPWTICRNLKVKSSRRFPCLTPASPSCSQLLEALPLIEQFEQGPTA